MAFGDRARDRLDLLVAARKQRAAGGAGERAGRRARVLAGATMGAVRATLREWLDAGGRPDLRALARETFAQLAGADEPRPPRPVATRGRR